MRKIICNLIFKFNSTFSGTIDDDIFEKICDNASFVNALWHNCQLCKFYNTLMDKITSCIFGSQIHSMAFNAALEESGWNLS